MKSAFTIVMLLAALAVANPLANDNGKFVLLAFLHQVLGLTQLS